MALTQVTTGGVDENINIDSNTLKVDGTNNRVGIGVSAPFGKLQVKAGTDANFLHTTAASEASLEIINDAGSANAPLNVRASEYKVKVGSDEKLRIDSSGRVLIGATAAANATTFLTVQNGSGDAQVTLNSGPTSESVINMGDTGDFNIGAIRYNQTDNAFRFFTSNAERMRVDGSGRVLIGTSTEGEHTADDLTVATDGDTGISIRSGTSNTGRLFFSDGTSSADEYRGFISYSHSDNAMLFGTDATERMRIVSSGRVGIDCTSPVKALQVGAHGTSSEGTIALGSSTSGTCSILMGDGGSGTDVYRGYVQYSHSADAMLFATSASERMRIDSDGRLIAGMTATWDSSIGHQFRAVSGSGWALNANSTNTGSSNHLLVTTGRNSSGDNMILVETNHGALGGAGTTMRFKVNGDGTIYATNTTVQSASDERLKENIRDSQDGLAVINQLRPVRFDWKQDQAYNEGTNQLGFIAQEVEQAFPEAVGIAPLPSDFTGDDPQYKTVAPGAFIPVLVKALQEASAKIETLETKVAALEAAG